MCLSWIVHPNTVVSCIHLLNRPYECWIYWSGAWVTESVVLCKHCKKKRNEPGWVLGGQMQMRSAAFSYLFSVSFLLNPGVHVHRDLLCRPRTAAADSPWKTWGCYQRQVAPWKGGSEVSSRKALHVSHLPLVNKKTESLLQGGGRFVPLTGTLTVHMLSSRMIKPVFALFFLLPAVLDFQEKNPQMFKMRKKELEKRKNAYRSEFKAVLHGVALS